MTDVNRRRALIKLGGGDQGVPDIQTVFSAVGFARTTGHDVDVDSLWLSTDKPLNIGVRGDNPRVIRAEVLDKVASEAIADIEIDAMLDPHVDPASLTRAMGEVLGIHPGAVIDARTRELTRSVIGQTLRRMGGVAVVSSSTPEGLSAVVGFYEDMRQLGAGETDLPSDQ